MMTVKDCQVAIRGSVVRQQRRLFSWYFDNVGGCLEMIMTQSGIVSGIAVRQAVSQDFGFDSGAFPFDVFVSRSEQDVFPLWEKYLREEGYSMEALEGTTSCGENQVWVLKRNLFPKANSL